MRAIGFACGAAALFLAGQAAAMECPRGKVIYEADPENREDYTLPFVMETLRIDGLDILLTKEGITTRYTGAGSAGMDSPILLVSPPHSHDLIPWRILRLKRIAGPNEPNHIIFFRDAVYWPVCRD